MKPAERTAIAALQKERKSIAVDANLYALGIADYPHARACFERRQEIDAAIAHIKGHKPPERPQDAPNARVGMQQGVMDFGIEIGA